MSGKSEFFLPWVWPVVLYFRLGNLIPFCPSKFHNYVDCHHRQNPSWDPLQFRYWSLRRPCAHQSLGGKNHIVELWFFRKNENSLFPAFLSRNFSPWKCFCKASWMTSSSDCTHCPSAWGSESSWGKIRDTGSFRILTPLGISWTNDFMQLSHHQTASRQLKRAKKRGKLQFEFSRQKFFSNFHKIFKTRGKITFFP